MSGLIDTTKAVYELAKKGMTIEFQEKLIQLHEQALELQEENLKLKKENQELKEKVRIRISGDTLPISRATRISVYLYPYIWGHLTYFQSNGVQS